MRFRYEPLYTSCEGLAPRLGVRSVARKPRKVLLSALILSLGLAFFVTALTIRASMLSTVDSVGRTKSFDLGVGLRAAEPVDRLKAWVEEIPEVRRGEYLSLIHISRCSTSIKKWCCVWAP